MLSQKSQTVSDKGVSKEIPILTVETPMKRPDKPLKPKSKTLTWVEWFNLNYPVFLSLLMNVSDVFLTLCRTLLVTLGVPVALIFIMYVEQERLFQGIEIFEVNQSLSKIAAWVLVILNTVLEFLVVYVEDKEGHIEEASFKNSARLLVKRIVYLIGFATLEKKSPANRYKGILSIVTFAILTLALLGSMHDEMLLAEGAWHQALWRLLTESSLIVFVTWVSSLLFTFTLVMSAQSLSNYVALHTTRVVREMNNKSNSIREDKQRQMEEEEERKKIELKRQAQKAGSPTDDPRIRLMTTGLYRANCPNCDWHKDEYISPESAKAGLTSHRPYCKGAPSQ